MDMQTREKESFAVIGLEGSTKDGAGFIQKLWAEANARFGEVASLASRDADGALLGIWGAMSDFSRSFAPWEDGFLRGLYLAGVECPLDAEAPEGWTKWVIPGYVYAYAEKTEEQSFIACIEHLRAEGRTLVGAAHDYTCPQTGKGYTFFPVRRL